MKKLQNKLQEKLQNRKQNNKGFSLVELIIVIAIMAILVGIVGTQVLPYINKSKESKDQQIINSYCTAALTAYSQNADKLTSTTTLTFDVYGASLTGDAAILAPDIKELTYATFPGGASGKFVSTQGKNITDITITYDFSKHTITAVGKGATGDFATVKGDL